MSNTLLFVNPSYGLEVGKIRLAKTVWTRFKGLLFSDPSKDPLGVWLLPCHSIHMVGMRFALDIIFLNKELKVMKICREVKPMTPVLICRGANSVLEFFPGHWHPETVKEGDILEHRCV